MYQIIKNVITRGDYDLSSMSKKITTLWVEGQITAAEHNELLSLARGGAKATNSVDFMLKLEDLEKRVRLLEENKPDATEDYPEYQSGKWYYNGDKCSFEGANYTCIAPDGVVCVWSPSDYPSYWGKVE